MNTLRKEVFAWITVAPFIMGTAAAFGGVYLYNHPDDLISVPMSARLYQKERVICTIMGGGGAAIFALIIVPLAWYTLKKIIMGGWRTIAGVTNFYLRWL